MPRRVLAVAAVLVQVVGPVRPTVVLVASREFAAYHTATDRLDQIRAGSARSRPS